jgi:hypothetical protein
MSIWYSLSEAGSISNCPGDWWPWHLSRVSFNYLDLQTCGKVLRCRGLRVVNLSHFCGRAKLHGRHLTSSSPVSRKHIFTFNFYFPFPPLPTAGHPSILLLLLLVLVLPVLSFIIY